MSGSTPGRHCLVFTLRSLTSKNSTFFQVATGSRTTSPASALAASGAGAASATGALTVSGCKQCHGSLVALEAEGVVRRVPNQGTFVTRLKRKRTHTIGAVIREGEILMDIVPENERLVIEAKVSPIDIDRVAIGQIADINFSAFKTRETTRILGRLINLSADSIIDERDSQQQPYYLAIVEVTRDGLKQLAEKELTLIAGMPAEVFIKTGERTLFQYLADPLVNTVARSFIED